MLNIIFTKKKYKIAGLERLKSSPEKHKTKPAQSLMKENWQVDQKNDHIPFS